jgi:S1-C subfamily serine protease
MMTISVGCTSNLPPQNSSVNPPSQPEKVSSNPEKEGFKSYISKQTVLITGKNTGTGIIIGQEGNKYYVLTSRHVVGIAPGSNVELPPNLGDDEKGLTNKEDPYKITTYDKQTYDVVYEEVAKDPKLDLAIITFNTQNQEKTYPVASLAALPIYKQQKVFVYGFKDCFNEGRDRREEFNEGTVVSIQNTDTDEGYSVKYTNPTIKGMSGSPVLDASGRVIAIHGKPGRDDKGDSTDCSALTQEFGNNYGISIESFKSSSLASRLQEKLSFDKKPAEVVTSTGNKSGELNQSPDAPIRFKKSNN